MAVQLTSDLELELQHIAAESHLSVDDVAQQALEEFVAYRRELLNAVREGEESGERDGWVPHEEVVRMMNERFKTS